MKRRIISFLLAFVMLLGMLPSAAMAADYGEEVTLSFSADGATGVPNPQTGTATKRKGVFSVYYVAEMSIPTDVPTLDGDTFAYWEASNGNKYMPGATIEVRENTTLTAVWESQGGLPICFFVVEPGTTPTADGSYAAYPRVPQGTIRAAAAAESLDTTGIRDASDESLITRYIKMSSLQEAGFASLADFENFGENVAFGFDSGTQTFSSSEYDIVWISAVRRGSWCTCDCNEDHIHVDGALSKKVVISPATIKLVKTVPEASAADQTFRFVLRRLQQDGDRFAPLAPASGYDTTFTPIQMEAVVRAGTKSAEITGIGDTPVTFGYYELSETQATNWICDPVYIQVATDGSLKWCSTYNGTYSTAPDSGVTIANQYAYSVTYSDGVDGEDYGDQVYGKLAAGAPIPAYVGAPSRPGHTFDGWELTSGIEGADGRIGTTNLVYTARWTPLGYTVTWKNWDGEVLEVDAGVLYGTMPEYHGETPAKAADSENSYTFSGWTPAVSPVTGDTTYTAAFSKTTNSYTITWKNADGTELEKDENVPYGTMPSYDGSTPAKGSDAQYHYTFSGWSPAVASVTGDAVYTATYTTSDRLYTVTWINHNKTTLETAAGVAYGTQIDLTKDSVHYTGETPVRDADADYTYVFSGWEIWADSENKDNPITGNTTFIARFEAVPIPRTATVEVVLNGAFDDDGDRDGEKPGANTDIGKLVADTDGVIYLKAAGGDYLALEKKAEGVYSLTGIANGRYHIYLKIGGSYVQVGAQVLVVDNADRTRYLPYYSVSYSAEGAANVPAATYYYIDSDVTVSSAVPTKSGFLFSHWSEGGASYTGGSVIGNITAAHTLTAQWVPSAKVDLTIEIDHKNDPTPGDAGLEYQLSRLVDGRYVAYPDTHKTGVTGWYTGGNATTTYQAITGYEVPKPSEDDFFNGIAYLDGYSYKGTDVAYTESTNTYDVVVKLEYDPASFLLEFAVKMAAGTPDALIPESVDVAVLWWDGDSWERVPGYETRTIDVSIDPTSKTGAGHFSAWVANNGEPYHYRVEVVDVDLPGDGHILPMSGANGAYSSSGDAAHPAGAYTAVVAVDGGSAPAAGALPGAYHSGGAQVGAITATVTAHPYDIQLDLGYDGADDDSAFDIEKTIEDRFTVPGGELTAPARSGYTFGGWYTGQDGQGVKIIGGEHIRALAPDLAAGGTLTLYACWKADLKVEGKVYVDLGFPCSDTSRKATVMLQMKKGDGTYYVTGFTDSVSLQPEEGKTYVVGEYSFAGVPDVGEYRVNLTVAADSNITYQNELSGDDYTETAYAAVDKDSNGVAVVNIHLWPQVYELGYLVDVSAVGEAFRPSRVMLDLRHDHRDDSGALTKYEYIKDLAPVETSQFGSVLKISDVPRSHANGRLYNYTISTVKYDVPALSYEGVLHYHYPNGEDPEQARPFAIRYTGPANYSAAANSDGLHQDVTLKASFTPNSYTISYDLAGGVWASGTTPTTLHKWSFDTEITAEPVRAGYTFTGWKADVDGAYDEGRISAAVWQPVTLTAQWKPVEYAITYELDGGSVAAENPTTYTVESGAITLLDPTRTGYTFKGWSGTDLTGDANKAVTIPAGSTGDRAYTANWTIDTYSIAVEVVNGTADPADSTISVEHGSDQTITFTADAGCALESVTVDGNVTVLTDGKYTFANVTEPHSIKVVYDADVIGVNGGSDGIPDRHQAAVTYAVVNGSFAEGFQSRAVFTVETCGANGLWSRIAPAPTLGGTIPAANKDMLPDTGYNGVGTWDAEVKADTPVTGDVTYTWTFTGVNDYDVTYSDHGKYAHDQNVPAKSITSVIHGRTILADLNGGKLEQEGMEPILRVDPIAVTDDLALPDPTRDHYWFIGWKCAAAPSAGVDYSYTAQWEPVRYAITYMLNGGTNAGGDPTFYTVESKPAVADPTRVGYTFSGWTITKTGTADPGTMADLVPLTYTANWSINTHTVTWVNEDGAELEKDESVEYGARPSFDGTTPAKAATAQYTYTFAGWALAEDGENIPLDISAFTVTGDVTFKAVYTPGTNAYTVTWVDADGTELEKDVDVLYGTVPSFDRAGGTDKLAEDKYTAQYTYTFKEWQLTSGSVGEGGVVVGDVTYTAAYDRTVNKYTVTWADYDGDVLKTEKVDYGTAPDFGGTPAREPDSQHNYEFDTWLDKESKLSEGKVVCDVTLTAGYTAAARLFTGQAELYLEVGGSDVLTGAETLLGSGVKLYFHADGTAEHHELLPVTDAGDNVIAGKYSASTLPNGKYKLYSSFDGSTFTKVCDHVLDINGGPATAKEYFCAVTYDANGGSGGPFSPVYYHEGDAVRIPGSKPTRADHIFEGWWYDGNGNGTKDAGETHDAGDVLTSGIYHNHALTAQWRPDIRAAVDLTITIHHSAAEGTDPNPGSALKIDLTRKDKDSSKDYVEVVGQSETKTGWYTTGAGTTVTSYSYEDIFSDLSGDYDYAVNVFLQSYTVSAMTVNKITDGSFKVTYDVKVTLQYDPDLFNLSFGVVADSSVPGELVPTAVDVKILAWDAKEADAWAPISRHEENTMEVLLAKDTSDGIYKGTGSYNVPVHKDVSGDKHYYYRVAVAGFTLPDGTELYAATADNAVYTAIGNSAAHGGAVTYAIPLYYGDGAYYGEVSVAFGPGEAAPGLALPGAYGHRDPGDDQFHQHGDITVTVKIRRYPVTLDLNYDGDDADTVNDVLTTIADQFRIPADIQTNAAYRPARTGYTFEGWYTDAACTDGNAVVPGTVLTEGVTLYAKWKPLLTISGNIAIAGAYGSNTIHFADRPASVEVTLYRKAPGSSHTVVYGAPVPVAVDNGTAETPKPVGTGSYAFADLPNDGSTYHITVLARNFTETFWNEDVTAAQDSYGDYVSGANTAVDKNGDNIAAVHAYLVFAPAIFDLDWEIDAAAIGADFRPASASTLVLYDDSPAEGYTWAVISQQIAAGGSAAGEVSGFDAAGKSVADYDVWQYHPMGHAYNYAIRLQSITYKPDGATEKTVAKGITEKYGDTEPFVIEYKYPAFYKALTGDQDILLTAVLRPKTYTVTLDANGGAVNGKAGDTLIHTWSFATAIPEPTRTGYLFSGWTASVTGAYDAGEIKASVHEDVKLTAQWIEIKNVTFTGVSGVRTYNGTEQTLTGITVVGLPDGYSHNVTYAASGKDAGTYTGVFAESDVVIKDENGNDVTDRFNVTLNPGELTINKAVLTVKAADRSKTYDGEKFSGFDYTVDGFKNSETAGVIGGSVSYEGDAVDAVNAGRYTITPDVSGLSAANYSFAAAEGTLTITPKEITPTLRADSKAYNGTTAVTGYTIDPGVANVTVAASSVVFADKNVGENKTVTATGLSLGGAAAANYKLADGLTALTAAANITPAQLTVKFTSADRSYDGTDVVNVSYSGFEGLIPGDQIRLSQFPTVGTVDDINAGDNRAVTVAPGRLVGTDSGNYIAVAEAANVNITKRNVTLTSQSVSRTYDGTPLTAPEVTVGGEGFVSGEVSGVQAAGTITEVGSTTNAITYSGETGFNENNYTITKLEGTLTVLPDANGDGKDDNFQKKVTFVVVNGTWGGSGREKVVYVDLDDQKNGQLTLPSDMQPDTGYANGAWNSGTPENGAAVSGTDDVTYTFTYAAISGLTYTVNYLEQGTNTVLHAQKVQDGKTFGDVVTAESEKISIPGYSYHSASTDTLTIGTDSAQNVMHLYYAPVQGQATVTFRVVNGTWADGTTADKTVTVTTSAGRGTLGAADIPAGMKAASGYTGGSWDVTPDTGSGAITADVTYVWTFAREAAPVVPAVPAPAPAPTVGTKGLNDVDHVAYVIGRGENMFDPRGNVTRAEVAAMYFRLMTDDFRARYWDSACSFADVADTAWYNVAIATLENAGAIKDTPAGGDFRPNEPITRAELAVMAAQFAQVTGVVPAAAFKDVPADHWAAEEIAVVQCAAWIEGYQGYYRPEDNLNRAECVTIINRMLKRGAEAENMLEGMMTFRDNVYGEWFYEAVQEASNSHDYTRTNVTLTGEKFRGEKWTAILEAPDWAALEKAWAASVETQRP